MTWRPKIRIPFNVLSLFWLSWNTTTSFKTPPKVVKQCYSNKVPKEAATTLFARAFSTTHIQVLIIIQSKVTCILCSCVHIFYMSAYQLQGKDFFYVCECAVWVFTCVYTLFNSASCNSSINIISIVWFVCVTKSCEHKPKMFL